MHRRLRLLAAALALLLAPGAASAGAQPLTVVELFTSQGCSSCPPADAFLGELARRDDILALSFHVDYWDYIGWKDPYASAANTARQRAYEQRFGLHYVYTPQMVIQGAAQATGSDRSAVLAAIAASRHRPVIPVTLTPGKGNRVIVSIPKGPATVDATVWLAVFDREHDTPVKRGENSGRTLKNYNVVRAMDRVGTWAGKAMEIPVTVPSMASGMGDACAVIVQARNNGPILGAAAIPVDSWR